MNDGQRLKPEPPDGAATQGKSLSRPVRWLLWALAAPFLALYGLIMGAGILATAAFVVLIVVAVAVFATDSLSAVPLVYVVAAFGAIGAGIGFGVAARLMWPRHGYSDIEHQPGAGGRRARFVRTSMQTTLVLAVAGVSYVLFSVFQMPGQNHPVGSWSRSGARR